MLLGLLPCVASVQVEVGSTGMQAADTVSHISEIVNQTNVPIGTLHGMAEPHLLDMIEVAQQSLHETGVASFPGFLTAEALQLTAAEAEEASPASFITDNKHNAWQLPYNESLPNSHLHNLFMRTRVASVAFDQIGPTLRALYEPDALLDFISAVTQRTLYRLADPLGACSINVFRDGWEHAWHFDESEYTVTLSLQQAEEGGAFLFTPPIRRNQKTPALESVASVLRAQTNFAFDLPASQQMQKGEGDTHEKIPVRTAPFQPGTLQVFAGRYSLHAVTPTSGPRERLVAVLCFATEPHVRNSAAVQKMFWGRSA